jgi:dihydropteroate synthase
MHMRGTPQTMDTLTDYGDVVADVTEELAERVAGAEQLGVPPTRIAVDPGLGFAKSAKQSLQLVSRIDELRALDRPVLVGPSRKRFIGGELADRLEGTLAVVAWCAMRGVEVVRVHDVRPARRVVDMIAALGEAAR